MRFQLGQGSAAQVTRTTLKEEGFGSRFATAQCLSAGLLRQATFTTARPGSFKMRTNKAIEANDGKILPLNQKALCGLTAGSIGACSGSPADLALIRVADEGLLALWKGARPAVVRAMLEYGNAGLLRPEC